ncbi:nucleotidyltransferase domain-containing protein [Jiangella anatolica]|uniref:Polymerase nucleotidyl transferase domain-containing protein n=1 Tax=Jiangella anatolica TaxID=2670374 RepID=A0A2W2CW86_9ACTN|nr:nucleotidyltransferase domain-containing protein [Jiangella anatolica]PZF84493.1 hypothetical protein C1I92_08705 [Jiangella anatolica]
MDMSEPATVAMPRGKIAVLRVLAGADHPFTIRELGRLAGVTHERAAQVVRELSGHGVVTVEPYGRARLCRLNREHLAAAPLIALVTLRQRLIELLRERLSGWSEPSLHASLFGSVARGDGDEASDIDVLVVRPAGREPDDEPWLTQLHETAATAHRATGNSLAWFELSADEIARAVRAREPIIAEWQRDGVHLAGVRLPELIRDAV